MEKKLHFVRLRAKEDTAFYDPLADFRAVFPAMVDMVLDDMRNQGIESEHVNYLHACFRVFQIRLLEDETPLTEQLRLFREALGKVPEKLRAQVMQSLSVLMFEFYALMTRRDQPLKEQACDALAKGIAANHWKSRLSADQYQQFCDMVGGVQDTDKDLPLSGESYAVCVETNKQYRRLRDMASRLVNAGGADSWDDIAELCDKQLDTAKLSDAESIALALAYPTYKNLSLMAEGEDKGNEA